MGEEAEEPERAARLKRSSLPPVAIAGSQVPGSWSGAGMPWLAIYPTCQLRSTEPGAWNLHDDLGLVDAVLLRLEDGHDLLDRLVGAARLVEDDVVEELDRGELALGGLEAPEEDLVAVGLARAQAES